MLALVDGDLTRQPMHRVLLVGNHEAHYLRDLVFDWPERISARSRDTLRRWWADGQMRVATWVGDDAESFLITHAGVTADFWRSTLGAPSSAEQAAVITINSLIGVGDGRLFRAARCCTDAGAPAAPVRCGPRPRRPSTRPPSWTVAGSSASIQAP